MSINTDPKLGGNGGLLPLSGSNPQPEPGLLSPARRLGRHLAFRDKTRDSIIPGGIVALALERRELPADLKAFHHPGLDRQKATELLKDKPAGTYLIMDPILSTCYMVMCIDSEKQIQHVFFNVTSEGKFALKSNAGSSADQQASDTLEELLSKRKISIKFPLQPVSPPAAPKAARALEAFNGGLAAPAAVPQALERSPLADPGYMSPAAAAALAAAAGSPSPLSHAAPAPASTPQVVEDPLTPEECDFEHESALDLGAEGMRTVQSRNFVVHLSCSLFNGAVVSAGKKKYMTLSGNSQEFSKIPHASCGSSTSREVLLLDPASSPLLDFHFKTLHTKLETLQRSQAAPLTPEQVLGTVKDYVRKQIFPSCSDPLLMQKLENMIEAARKDGHHEIAFNDTKPSVKIPIMSIEEFVQDGIGVCRHHGLVVSYLLDRLTQEPAGKPFLEGTVQHIRDNVPGGAHAWETFIPKAKAGMPAQKWHIDTLWNKLENFADAEAFNRLTRSYGDAMIRQQDRTKEAARINGQPLAVIDLSTGPALAKAVPADAQNRPKPAALTPIRPEPRYIHAQMMAVPADAKDNVKRIHRIHRPKPAALALISPIQLKGEADAQAPAAVTAPYAGALAAPVLTPRMPMALRAAAFQAADVSKPQKTAPEQSPGL